MKKIVIGLIFSSLLLGACGNTTSSTNSDTQKTIDSLKTENSKLKSELKKTTNEAKNEKIKFNKVGIIEYTINSINTKQVKKSQKNFTNAEYNFSNIDDFPEKYYRTAISYELKNIGTEPFELSTYQAKIIDDNNMEYTSNSIENFGYDQNSNGTVQPNTSTTGTFYLLSKEKPQITNFKINISEQYSDSQDKLGDSGIAQKVNESN
ncbi:DUF4352 domain-containing protein [Enterococcus sp. AZ050]|uniref:DUF4352 domain-containing protein n=1 Tax=Enterococcus sp. AZ050 TaxID=2774696 RepID=UPI00192855C5